MTKLASQCVVTSPNVILPRHERTCASRCRGRLPLNGFGDATRLNILQLLSHDELRTVDIVAALQIPQSTASKHLACLRDCGLVEVRPVGRANFYSLTQPELTLALLRAAEDLLVETGEAVALCENFGVGSEGRLS